MEQDTQEMCIWRRRVGSRQCMKTAGAWSLCPRHQAALLRRLPGGARFGRTVVLMFILTLSAVTLWSAAVRG